jgi:hypothetical protein
MAMKLAIVSLVLLSGCAYRPQIPVSVCLAAIGNDNLTQAEYSQVMLVCTSRKTTKGD